MSTLAAIRFHIEQNIDKNANTIMAFAACQELGIDLTFVQIDELHAFQEASKIMGKIYTPDSSLFFKEMYIDLLGKNAINRIYDLARTFTRYNARPTDFRIIFDDKAIEENKVNYIGGYIIKDAKTGDSEVRKWSDLGIDYVLDYAKGFIETTMNATSADEL